MPPKKENSLAYFAPNLQTYIEQIKAPAKRDSELFFLAKTCNRMGRTPSQDVSNYQKRVQELEKTVADLKPGLGEMMGVIREHHAKLYHSGHEQNWDLAQYQIDEIREGFDEVVKYYPRFKEVKLPLSELVPTMIHPPLDAVAEAIKKKDKTAFGAAYGQPTRACNSKATLVSACSERKCTKSENQ